MSGTRLLKWPIGDVSVPTARSCRLVAVVVLGLLSVAAAVVAARAMAGALRSPLNPAALLSVCMLVAAAGVAVRLGWLLPIGAARVRRLDLAVMATTSFAAAALCGGLCLPPGTPLAAVIVLRVVLVAEEGWAWLWYIRKWSRNGSSPIPRSPESSVAQKRGQNCFSRAASPSESLKDEKKSSDPFLTPAAQVTQQFTRSETADGAEELSGWLRLPFAPGQRTGSVHVAFCPPLRITPELTVEQIEGPEARIKTAQLLPYGARFDLKLATSAEEPTAVLLQFTARTPREE